MSPGCLYTQDGRTFDADEGRAAEVEVVTGGNASDCFGVALVPDGAAARFDAGFVGKSRSSRNQRRGESKKNQTHNSNSCHADPFFIGGDVQVGLRQFRDNAEDHTFIKSFDQCCICATTTEMTTFVMCPVYC